MPFIIEDDTTNQAPAPASGFVVEDDAPQADTRSPLVKAINTGARASETVGAKAISGILGLLGDIPAVIKAGEERAGRGHPFPSGIPQINNPFPTSADIMAQFSKIAPPYIPTSKTGQYADRAATGALQAAVLGGGNLPSVLAGAGAGVGSKIGHDMHPDSPAWEIGGGLLGGGLLGGVSNWLRPTPAKVATSILEGKSEPQIDAAVKLQNDSNALKLGPLTAPEALNSKYGLSVQRLLEQDQLGGGTRAIMEQRGPRAAIVSGQQIDSIGPSLTPREGMTSLEAAGNSAISAKMKERAAKAGPFYKAADKAAMASQPLVPLIGKIDEQIVSKGQNSEVGRALSELKTRIQAPMNGNLAEVGPLEQTYKEFRDRLSRPGIDSASLSGAESSANGVLSGIVGDLGKIVEQGSADVANGRAAHIAATPEVDALAKGLTGDLTQSKSLSQAAATFVNPKNETPADIMRAATAIGSKNKDAVPALVQQYLRDKLDAAKSAVSADTSRLGAKFNQTTLGARELDPRQAANIEAAIRALPNGSDIWNGFERVQAVYRAQGNRYVPGSATAYNQIVRNDLETNGLTSPGSITQFVAHPLDTVFDKIKNHRLRTTYSVLDRVFSSPDSVQQLRAIAKEPNRRRAKVLIGTFIGERPSDSTPAPQ